VNAPWLASMAWRHALFLHWPIPVEILRPLVPRDLEIDVFEGSAWIGIVAFEIARARPRGFPEAFGAPAFGEVNVRTYVDGGKPGVWFLSLDAASAVTVFGGRRIMHLPYHRARVDAVWDDRGCSYRAERTEARSTAARFAAAATFAGDERRPRPGTLEHRLVERYCLYTVDPHGRTVRGDVAHEPWPLRDASAEIAQNTLISAAQLPQPPGAPLAHASRGVSVRAWPLRRR
jgi:uncharacterized protein YqjF (DUF2071 family)